MLATSIAGTLSACSSDVTVATFNIRKFPEPSTDIDLVAHRIAELDASIIAVQEIRDADAMAPVLELASHLGERDFRLLVGPCGGDGGQLTTGVIFDAATWEVIEHVGYPDLQPDEVCQTGQGRPGTLGVFEDEDGRQFGVMSVHLWPFPDAFDKRKQQWARLLERIDEVRTRHSGLTMLTLGDYNTTGFSGDPQAERPWVEDTVEDAGYTLPTAELECTEYWRPSPDEGYRPSLLDHVVVSGGKWSKPRVHGLCKRLDCKPVDPPDMDPDFFTVSDHCPVVIRGTP